MIIEICGAQWEVKLVTGRTIKKRAEELVDGYCDFDSQTIYVRSEIHKHRQALALTHEWLHVINDYIGYDKSDEEELVMRMEHHIYDLINKFPREYLRYSLDNENRDDFNRRRN